MQQHPKQLEAYERAKSHIGTLEVPGGKHNPKILEWFKKVGHPQIVDDETSWCAAFTGAMLEEAGLESTKSLLARSYEKWGVEVPLDQALPGDLVVNWRVKPDSWQGHIGFFHGRKKGKILILGGNQKNRVSVDDFSEGELLSVRRMPAPKPQTFWEKVWAMFQKVASGGSKQ
jgi:uncharacterized protein (TIGR02594 family)